MCVYRYRYTSYELRLVLVYGEMLNHLEMLLCVKLFSSLHTLGITLKISNSNDMNCNHIITNKTMRILK